VTSSRIRTVGLAIASLLIAIEIALATAAYTASVTVVVGSGRAPAGADVAIPISVKGAPGIDAMHVEITFDAAVLDPKSVEKGSMLSGNSMMAFNPHVPGRLIAGFTSLDPIQGDGQLLVAHFTARGRPFASSALHAENLRAWVQASNHQNYFIAVVANDGRFTAAMPMWMPIAAAVLAIVLLLLIVRMRRHSSISRTAAPAATAAVGRGGSASTGATCRSCGQPLRPTALFCTKCGAAAN
jgi:hypothetical protein